MNIENISEYAIGKICFFNNDLSALFAPNFMLGGGSSECEHNFSYNIGNNDKDIHYSDCYGEVRRKASFHKNTKVNKKFKICEKKIKNPNLIVFFFF